MTLNIQPFLENQSVILYPLQEDDFEELYAVASDAKIWEQHPNKDRWKKDVFRIFFEGAMQSKGAFKIVDKTSGKIIGCTRYYDYDEQEKCIHIGYTFYATQCWGTGVNRSVKKLMLDYIFNFVSTVYFQVGSVNTRSQIAIARLGATKIREQTVSYYGEEPKLNFVYSLPKEEWNNRQEIK